MPKTISDIMDSAIADASGGAPDPNAPAHEDTAAAPVGTEGGEEETDLLEGLEDEETPPRVAAEGDEAQEGEEAVDEDGNELHRDPTTGRFIKKPEETPEEKTAREAADTTKLGPDGKPLKEGKKPDPINDPIPKDLAQPTQERIRSLIATTKEVTQARDEIQQNFNYMVNGIQATGTTVEQYGELLSFMGLFNSGDPAQQEKALELVEGVAQRLSELLGKERKIPDALEAHKDLQADVAANKISPERAKEIARWRNSQNFRGQLQQTAQTQHSQQQQAQRERTDAKTALTSMENTLKSTDPQYYEKRALMVPILKAVFPITPPRSWPQVFQNAYRSVVVPQGRQRPAPTRGAAQPIRPNRQPGGRQAPAVNDGLDVINQALENMPGR